MRTVLVVDDSEPTHTLLRSAFARAGYRTCHATDVRTALDLLASEPIDAMITDIVMPDMDGLQFVHTARAANEVGRSLPTVFYSAYLDSTVRSRVGELQPATIVEKDGDVQRLVDAVTDLIDAHTSIKDVPAAVILHVGIGLVAISTQRNGQTIYELRRGERVLFEGATIEDVTEHARASGLA